MRPRSKLLIFGETMIGMLFLALVFGLASLGIELLVLALAAIPGVRLLAPFVGAIGVMLGVVATMCPLFGLWQPIASMLGIWRIECVLSTGEKKPAHRWWVGGVERWGVGVDLAGIKLDVYTVGGRQ